MHAGIGKLSFLPVGTDVQIFMAEWLLPLYLSWGTVCVVPEDRAGGDRKHPAGEGRVLKAFVQ